MSENESPLIQALPPATDYLTYLTLIEYNLTVDNLPILHKVLQDEKLTTNIGWDLVHLLMPLLPASEECLQDIARLGNPREVVLKATEALRLIDFEGLEPDSDDDEPIASDEAQHSKHPAKTKPVEVAAQGSSSASQAAELPPPPPLPVMQFTSLLSMLSILHPRIKTQYPSRFLSTSLQAVLAAFSNAVSHREELLLAALKFIKTISGTKRPMLPPRKSSLNVLVATPPAPAPDPEPDVSPNGPSSAEAEMQSRLAYSFITHLLEEYILTCSSDVDAPGLAWCSRLQEKMHPERTIPNKASMTEVFTENENLKARLTAVGELIALGRDLGIKAEDLKPAIFHDDSVSSGDRGREDEPPKTAADIPLAKVGSLFLFTAANVSTVLFPSSKPQDAISIFPDHQKILETFVGSSGMGSTIGTEPEAVLDAVLALAILAVEDDNVGRPVDNEQFNQYLQYLSLISSNSPSPSIRHHAFFLTSTILRSNPSDVERLAFIRDTLEHCPFDNLKVAAVSWIKGETIEANPPTEFQPHDDHVPRQSLEGSSVFVTPVALDTLAPFLFPDLTHDLTSTNVADSYMQFEQHLRFYMAILNFYFLLLAAPHLHEALAIGSLHNNNDIAGSFLYPLKAASTRYREEGKAGGKLEILWKESGEAEERLAQLNLLDATLERVTTAVNNLNKA
ncbi:YAP-binding/ALF4/Glomulin [Delphinella strobiligena]|nr:YAP-binding/ALF4/Glomulin [Delphinella strobiligena]